MTFNFHDYDVLTFDCYGTLIDWETGILTALRPILERHGSTLSDDQILELFGEFEAEAEAGPYRTYREVLALVMDGFGRRLGFTPSEEERAALGNSVKRWPPFPDSIEGLHRLARHYKLAILSNIDDELFAESAKLLDTPFAAVVTAQQAGSYKPNLQNFRLAIERVGVPKERILHVAQSLFHDIAPANQVGLTTVWVNRRHDRPGFGATPAATGRPDLEVPDLATLARMVDDAFATQS